MGDLSESSNKQQKNPFGACCVHFHCGQQVADRLSRLASSVLVVLGGREQFAGDRAIRRRWAGAGELGERIVPNFSTFANTQSEENLIQKKEQEEFN